MKIEVITMHRVVNYGSVLQCFAFQHILENAGVEVEILDYYPKRYHAMGMLKSIKHKVSNSLKCWVCRLVIIPSYIKRFYIFKRFIYKNLHMSSKQYRSLEELRDNYPMADVYCIGSDQVWNSTWSEGIDLTFYLSFLSDEEKRIAYAASIGKKELSEHEKELISPYLKKYDWISVREYNAGNILRQMDIKADVVLDPTLLMSKNEWKPYISDRFSKQKYILVYNLNREETVDSIAKRVSKLLNLPLYYVGYNFHEMYKGKKYFCNPKVEDFLSLIYYAEFVIGDSFHMAAFSINFHKNFFSVCPKKFADRIENILQIVDLNERLLSNDLDCVENNTFDEILKKSIDFNTVEEKLETLRNYSKELLQDELSKITKAS